MYLYVVVAVIVVCFCCFVCLFFVGVGCCFFFIIEVEGLEDSCKMLIGHKFVVQVSAFSAAVDNLQQIT